MSNPMIKMEIEGFGTVEAELYPDKAPLTVKNFLKLVDGGFFDGLVFHRIIAGFMIQGGGYDAHGRHRDAESIYGEFAANGFPQNDIKHTRGVLSMARTMVPDSASSQFFIMHENAPHLDGQYAAFGKVTSGIDVVDKVAAVRTDFSDAPLRPVIISSVRTVASDEK